MREELENVINIMEGLIQGSIESYVIINTVNYTRALQEEDDDFSIRHKMCVMDVENLLSIIVDKMGPNLFDFFIRFTYISLLDEMETEYLFDINPLKILYPVDDETSIEYQLYMITRYLYTKILLSTNWDLERAALDNVVPFIPKK